MFPSAYYVCHPAYYVSIGNSNRPTVNSRSVGIIGLVNKIFSTSLLTYISFQCTNNNANGINLTNCFDRIFHSLVFQYFSPHLFGRITGSYKY